MNLKNKTFFIKSLGCRVNLFESNGVLKQLSDLGAIYVDNESNAEIIVINTCSVTNKADSKSRYEINKACNSEKCELVVVIGCYSQLNAKEIVNDKVKIIIGTAYKSEVGSLIKELKPKQTIKKIINVRKENKFEADKEADYRLNTRAFVKIQDGCNFMCSYCLIPYARGVQRSMPDGELIETIKNLVANNFKEIILTGVNTAGYKYKNVTFYDILKKIDKLDGDFRIRISSLEPFQINAKIIKLLTSNKER
jgi:threonylcarbamoyladenosine tRNA methylthiotransferase MtaB